MGCFTVLLYVAAIALLQTSLVSPKEQRQAWFGEGKAFRADTAASKVDNRLRSLRQTAHIKRALKDSEMGVFMCKLRVRKAPPRLAGIADSFTAHVMLRYMFRPTVSHRGLAGAGNVTIKGQVFVDHLVDSPHTATPDEVHMHTNGGSASATAVPTVGATTTRRRQQEMNIVPHNPTPGSTYQDLGFFLTPWSAAGSACVAATATATSDNGLHACAWPLGGLVEFPATKVDGAPPQGTITVTFPVGPNHIHEYRLASNFSDDACVLQPLLVQDDLYDRYYSSTRRLAARGGRDAARGDQDVGHGGGGGGGGGSAVGEGGAGTEQNQQSQRLPQRLWQRLQRPRLYRQWLKGAGQEGQGTRPANGRMQVMQAEPMQGEHPKRSSSEVNPTAEVALTQASADAAWDRVGSTLHTLHDRGTEEARGLDPHVDPMQAGPSAPSAGGIACVGVRCVFGSRVRAPIAPEQAQYRDGFVVVNRLFTNVTSAPELAAALDHSIAHYHALGANRQLVYVYPHTLDFFTSSPRLQKWMQAGVLVFVEWTNVPSRTDAPFMFVWDQRMVYNHAMLALTGLDVGVAMLDVDEYLVSPHPHLSSMEALMHACVKATPVSVVVPRLHAIPEHWNHSLPEIGLWLPEGSSDGHHPLDSYTLLMERLHVPGPKTLANPNGLYAFYVHFASPYLPHTRLVVEESCMYLVHIKNLFSLRVHAKHLAGFKPEDMHAKALRNAAAARKRARPIL